MSQLNIKRFDSGSLLELLTITNSVFNKYQNKQLIEKEIFLDPIISSDVPIEFQEDEVKKEENFNKRYILSSGITGIAIIELAITERYGNDLYANEVINFKKKVFGNILKLRTEILQYQKTPFEIEYGIDKYADDDSTLEDNDSAFNAFLTFTKARTFEIKNLLIENGDCHNLLFHFDAGLGQILPGNRSMSYGSNTKKIVKQMVEECWQLVNTFFNSI